MTSDRFTSGQERDPRAGLEPNAHSEANGEKLYKQALAIVIGSGSGVVDWQVVLVIDCQ